jgi:hypothetical protein
MKCFRWLGCIDCNNTYFGSIKSCEGLHLCDLVTATRLLFALYFFIMCATTNFSDMHHNICLVYFLLTPVLSKGIIMTKPNITITFLDNVGP